MPGILPVWEIREATRKHPSASSLAPGFRGAERGLAGKSALFTSALAGQGEEAKSAALEVKSREKELERAGND